MPSVNPAGAIVISIFCCIVPFIIGALIWLYFGAECLSHSLYEPEKDKGNGEERLE